MLILGGVFIGLLTGPVWALYYVSITLPPTQAGPVSLTILTVFTYSVWSVISLLTSAKPQEALAITSAYVIIEPRTGVLGNADGNVVNYRYAAVLIVFIGNISTSGMSVTSAPHM